MALVMTFLNSIMNLTMSLIFGGNQGKKELQIVDLKNNYLILIKKNFRNAKHFEGSNCFSLIFPDSLIFLQSFDFQSNFMNLAMSLSFGGKELQEIGKAAMCRQSRLRF